MEVEGTFPTQGMVMELRSIRMTWTAAEDGQFNLALPSWDWEASVSGIKNPCSGSLTALGKQNPW